MTSHRFIAAFLILVSAATNASATDLAKLAASMKPGSWAELKTEGYTPELLKVQTHHILEYTDTAVWDPKSQQVLFVGQGHYSALRFIAYAAEKNTWTTLPTPAWWKGDDKTGKGPIGHAYQNNTIDAANGVLYHHQSATRLVHKYDIAKREWSTLPEIKNAAVGHGTALAYFPERNGLVRVLGGAVHFYDEETNAWSALKEPVVMGPYHNIARYNPVNQSVIFGAGNSSKVLHRMGGGGKITRLADAPFVIRISSTITAIDPACGDLLVVNMADKKFHALDIKKNEWRQLPDAPITEGVAVPIDTHGVTMVFSNRPAKVHLYKHAAAKEEKASPVDASDAAQDKDLREQAKAGLRKACGFFRDKVSTEGGYLWRYSADLAKREGESKATTTQIWIQPPGTPSVGQAWLDAYRATGDRFYLDGAVAAAHALARGQLYSGGWDYHIEFEPAKRKVYAYRVDGNPAGKKNVSTLDDDTTQAALRFLMNVDVALEKKDAKVHNAVEFALAQLLKTQYPNGAWPQRFSAPPEAAKFPVKKASFPKEWSREFPKKDYRDYYTFNDNSIATMIDTMLLAAQLYDEPRYRKAALNAGDFMILAQLPEPQPGWAQQYDLDMHPAWARKFEPPAVTGGESQGVMRSLLKLYAESGDKKYLEPIPRALAYYRKSQLPDGKLARFYEMQTNRPLYFTKKYEMTYKDDDLPTHYGFKVGHKLDAIAKDYDRLVKLSPDELKKKRPSERPKANATLVAQVKETLKALDGQGRWIDAAKLKYQGADDKTDRIIDCATFIRNVGVLSRYLDATR